jgi:hypothetical protein
MNYAHIVWIHFLFLSIQSLIIKPDEMKHLAVYGTNWNSVLQRMFEVIQPDPNVVK